MATQAFYDWDRAGRPWRLAQPIADIQKWCQVNGFEVLGTIGNEEHLTAEPPEDHTPFSATAYPVPLPGYVVTAIDIEPSAYLGEAVLKNARAGLTPWLKYCNVGGWHYTWRDGFQTGRANPDRHIHLSIFSDWCDRSITFDPFGADVTEEQYQTIMRKLTGIELTQGSFIQGFTDTVPLPAADGTERQFPIIPNHYLVEIIQAVEKLTDALKDAGGPFGLTPDDVRTIVTEQLNKTRLQSS